MKRRFTKKQIKKDINDGKFSCRLTLVDGEDPANWPPERIKQYLLKQAHIMCNPKYRIDQIGTL